MGHFGTDNKTSDNEYVKNITIQNIESGHYVRLLTWAYFQKFCPRSNNMGISCPRFLKAKYLIFMAVQNLILNILTFNHPVEQKDFAFYIEKWFSDKMESTPGHNAYKVFTLRVKQIKGSFYGNSAVVEVNGDILQVLARIYWFTGNREYLEWAADKETTSTFSINTGRLKP